jgi:hypothetical protein
LLVCYLCRRCLIVREVTEEDFLINKVFKRIAEGSDCFETADEVAEELKDCYNYFFH